MRWTRAFTQAFQPPDREAPHAPAPLHLETPVADPPNVVVSQLRAVDGLSELTSNRTEPTRGRGGRVTVDGKFLSLAGRPFRVRGATYGSFRPRRDGELFPEPAVIRTDFAAMREVGLNTVRTYVLPPADLLELAAETGLRVIAGLHYRDWREEPQSGLRTRRRILDAGRRAVEAALERCDGRDEVLAVAVGNEVPTDLVRLHGVNSVEKTLSALVAELHAGSDLLATYVNYPTTEYLRISGQDIACFNVFLEQPDELKAYLRHLHVVAGNVPLVISELGLASDLHGAEAQADSLAYQLLITEECGCAGATVFSWTDEWAVGGRDVEGWGFGVTAADRTPKPALAVLRTWARTDVTSLRERWPSVSVVVCAHNEADLVERCLASLLECNYPDLEIVFCDDGSTDGTLEIARRFPLNILALPHGGLSNARNAGIAAATGSVVAFLDADAECHPEWPYHLVVSLEEEAAVATGGPNLPPPGRPFVERAVARAPGAPVHVLVKDDRAEHVPGCNMAFLKGALDEISGFDPIYTSAGDDVDLCWRLLDRGHEIAFAPTAQVRHHRPASVAEYCRQQRSYGRAERMLAVRHRHRFNTLGQARWSGFIYTGPPVLRTLFRPVIYHGPMGLAPFQKVMRQRSQELLDRASPLLPLTLPVALLGVLALRSSWWLAAPLASLATLIFFAAAVALAVRPGREEPHPLALRVSVGALHVLQPLVRTWGRLRGSPGRTVRAVATSPTWSGDRVAWLLMLMRELDSRRCAVRSGNPTRGWDISVSVGPLVACRVTTAVVWNWTPRVRLAFRPRLPAALALIGACILTAFEPGAGAIALILLATAAAAEGLLVRRVVRSAVASSTRGITL